MVTVHDGNIASICRHMDEHIDEILTSWKGSIPTHCIYYPRNKRLHANIFPSASGAVRFPRHLPLLLGGDSLARSVDSKRSVA